MPVSGWLFVMAGLWSHFPFLLRKHMTFPFLFFRHRPRSCPYPGPLLSPPASMVLALQGIAPSLLGLRQALASPGRPSEWSCFKVYTSSLILSTLAVNMSSNMATFSSVYPIIMSPLATMLFHELSLFFKKNI